MGLNLKFRFRAIVLRDRYKLQFSGVRRLLTKASLREGGGPLAVEGACGAVRQNSFHRNAFSLSRLRRQLPPGGSLTAKICVVKLTDKSKFELT